MPNITSSPRLRLDKADANKIGKAFLWSLGSITVTALLAYWQEVDVPAGYALAIPVVNAVLYGLQKLIKK